MTRALGRVALVLFLALAAGCATSSGTGKKTASVWRSLSADERARLETARQEALERRLSGEPVAWGSAATGRAGEVVVVRTLRLADGRYCRDYRETLRISGKQVERHRRACRDATGYWRTLNQKA